MENIYSYIEKYKNKSFYKVKFNEVDNLILSLVSYVDFSSIYDSVPSKTIEELGKTYLSKVKLKDIKKYGIIYKDSYKLLKTIVDTKRYKGISISNYEHFVDKDIQFCAMTFKISKFLNYICFQGTDYNISGWKEDAEFACIFPVPSQLSAIKYLQENIKVLGPDVIVGGHSKGGNLSLVGSMYISSLKQAKIRKIYNNDGPGLRKKEIKSILYKTIKYKYVHIVPSTSVVGVLLRNDKYKVAYCEKKNIFSHSPVGWHIEDKHVKKSKLSIRSKRLEKSLISWLDNHDDNTRIKLINNVFNLLDKVGIDDTSDFRNIKNIISLIKASRSLDDETKNLVKDLILFNVKSVYKGIDNL